MFQLQANFCGPWWITQQLKSIFGFFLGSGTENKQRSRSMLALGGPLKGFLNGDDRGREQSDKIGENFLDDVETEFQERYKLMAQKKMLKSMYTGSDQAR